jgi:RNA polymerase sigma factor (sigma-70 family)
LASPTLGTFLTGLRQAMAAEALAARPDRELVERLRAGPDEAAFRAVLDRHGSMVFRVCRRVLAAPADVEDAFQATFLVLVRRGHAIRRRESLAGWLHGVARRTALKLRTQSDRRRRREGRAARPASGVLPDDAPWGEVKGVLDDELGRLPDACRAALVLCYLEGRTQDEAAARLGVSKSTLRRNLDRGRDLLGRRLARRGVALAAAMAARLVSDCAQGAGVPRALLLKTSAFATHPAPGLAAPAGAASARVAALTEGVTRAMIYSKYKAVAVVLACGLVVGFGAGHAGPRFAAAQDAARGPGAPPPAAAAAPDIEPIDPHLVFDPEVQKQLRLSPNQVQRLTEARDKGGADTADRGKRITEIDQRLQKLQEEIARLQQERASAQQAVHRTQGEQVKAAIPGVLSREAVGKLRELTLQRMRLADVLLEPRVRARLDLNDEQVKRIQEVAEKGGGITFLEVQLDPRPVRYTTTEYTVALMGGALRDVREPGREELLKVLTPQQRATLDRLAGTTVGPKK